MVVVRRVQVLVVVVYVYLYFSICPKPCFGLFINISSVFILYLLLNMLVTLPTCHDDRSELNTELTKNAVVAVAMVVINLVVVFVYK